MSTPLTTQLVCTTYRCTNPPYCHTEVQYMVTLPDMQVYSCTPHLSSVQSLMNDRATSVAIENLPTAPDPSSLP